MAAAGVVADHDHEAGDEPEVVRAEGEVFPRARDIGEVLAQSGVAEVRSLAPQHAPGALEVQLAVGGQMAHDAVDVAPAKGPVYRPHHLDVVGDAGGIAVIRGSPGL